MDHVCSRNVDLRRSSGLNGGLTLEHDDAVGKIGGHDEVVLDDERRLLCVEDESAVN